MTNVVLAVSLAVRFGPFLSSRVLTPYLGPSPFKLSTISKCDLIQRSPSFREQPSAE
jgi:hypothetical protein